MTRALTLLAAAVVGLATGAAVTLAVQSPAAVERPAGTPTAADPVVPAPVPEPDQRVLLVWTAEELPPALADRVRALPGVRQVTAVAGDRVDLVGSTAADGAPVDDLAPGWAVPLDALAIDPAGYAAFVPPSARPAVAGLRAGEALLSATSARLRGVGPGATLSLAGGTTLTVTAVLDDTLLGAAEVVLPAAAAAGSGVTTARFLLVAYAGDRVATEAAIRAAAPAGVRVRGPGETPYLRHGDAVLPQALIKERFGEFAYRPPGAGERVFVQDPAWERAHVVAAEVPILGRVRCHRGVIGALEGALGELAGSGLAALVDRAGYAGCHHPRLIAPGGGVSRHAWGVALDLNAADNPTGTGSSPDPRLVEVMERWGFTWGGFWLHPDPAHFEYVAPPDELAVKVPAP